jgi:hypothetical protein
MDDGNPAVLLHNPELVQAVAPWCVVLDNLELGILLLAQPWLASGGMRRADLERQLSHLAQDLPIGPVYFQRVNRAVARLEDMEAVSGEGSGRWRRFVVTPRGFAALILNLRVLHADPTIDGSEFEFKRALVAMWNLVLERVSELPEELPLDPALEDFFHEVEGLEVWGRRVVTDELVGRALDILGLIEVQRQRIAQLLEQTERRLEQLRAQGELLRDVDLADLAKRLAPGAAASLMEDPAAAAMVRVLATTALPDLNLRVAALRYRRYVEYLDELATLYSRELRVVDLDAMRRLAGRAAG